MTSAAAGAHVGEVLQRWARDAPDRAALIEPSGRQITFGQLRRRVGRLAGALRSRGLAPGDHVVLLIPMGIPLYEALLALFWGGSTAVLVDPSAGVQRMGQALDRIGVQGLIGTPKAHLLRAVVPALRGGKLYAADGWVPGTDRLDRLDADEVPRTDPPDGEPALVTFTTGTTGAPKAIGRSHAFLMAQHRVLAGHMGLGSDDVDLPTLPVFLLNSLGAGATCVLPDADLRDVASVDPARVLRQIRERGVTSSSGSPAFYQPLVDALVASGERVEGVRKLFLGGARVPPTLLEGLADRFPNARTEVVYGSTEAEPIATIDAREALACDGACVGRPVPGISLRLVDGEVQVAGDHVNTAYYRDPSSDAAQKVRADGRIWHRTGDVAELDAQGRLWLLGRVGEDVAGRWPFPTESAAERIPGVTRAALVALDGVPVLAFSGTASPAEVGAALDLRAVHVAEIPVDPRHRAKVDRTALLRLLA